MTRDLAELAAAVLGFVAALAVYVGAVLGLGFLTGLLVWGLRMGAGL